MSSLSAVHNSKKEAILQLCNFLCPNSISKITDLADGDVLQKAIQAIFPEFSNDNCVKIFNSFDTLVSEKEDSPQLKEVSDNLNFMIKDASNVQDNECIKRTSKHLMKNGKESEDINTDEYPEIESDVKEHETLEKELDVANTTPKFKKNQSLPARNEAILLKYSFIKKFIDDHYQIKSEVIISYKECLNHSELELLKMALFVLSEIVSFLLKNNKADVQTLTHLETTCQEELEECFALFLIEREKISKTVVEELLSKSVNSASPVVTPRRKSSRLRERKSLPPPTPSEDVFTNSPLKSFFESPIFKKEDIIMKEKEVLNLKKTLEFGEEESLKLSRKLLDVENELKKKDKDYKKLQKQMAQMKEEIQFLQNSCQSEFCKTEKEKLFIEINMSQNNAVFLTNQVAELNGQIAELQRFLEEKENMEELQRMKKLKSSPLNENTVLKTAARKITAYEDEIGVLRESIRNLELKNHAYKKQLSELILTNVKETNSAGNLNQSYEERWDELDKERKEMQENIGYFIEAENKILFAQLNEANLKIQKLLAEIEILKKQSNKQEKISDHLKTVCSIATMTMPELIDTTVDKERLRNSLNHSKYVEHCHLSDEHSFILNNSDNPTDFEHSIVSPKLEVIPSPEKSSEAVLWKTYNSETENICAINLDLNSVVSENSHIDMISDLGINNDKIDNAETDASLGQENKYVLGNLNFNVFLNELKKLTKNGSFQKVLQVFGKCQKEINGTNRSNRLDLQEMLKMITECVCVAVALNAESSFANRQDKCCLTDENHNIEFGQAKKKITAVSKKYEIELKKCKKELEELKKEKSSFELKYQACDQQLSEKNQMFEELFRKYSEMRTNWDYKVKKYNEIKAVSKRIMDSKRKLYSDFQQLKNAAVHIANKRNLCDKINSKLRAENDDLKKILQKLKDKISKVEKELFEEKCKAQYTCSDFQVPSTSSTIGIPHHPKIKSEFPCSSVQDTTNDSVLSGAFHKNISLYVSENEEDYFNYNSLDVIRKEYKEDRVEELKRRNSFLPLHLQSAYPVEANLHTANESLYVKDGEKNVEENCSKKRKLDDAILEEPTCSTVSTPVMKPKKRIETPKSLQKFMKNIRSRHTFPMKPRKS